MLKRRQSSWPVEVSTLPTVPRIDSSYLVHGFRHTFAAELANGNVSVYALMKLLGHESMVTSQRYVDGAGTENRAAAAQEPAVRPDRTVSGTVAFPEVSLLGPAWGIRPTLGPERIVASVTGPESREF
jgi:Phage integrase family